VTSQINHIPKFPSLFEKIGGVLPLHPKETYFSTSKLLGFPEIQLVLLKKGVSLGHQAQVFSAPTPSLDPEVHTLAFD